MTFKHQGAFSMTAFGQPQTVAEFPVNFENKDPHMNISIYQNCSGQKRSTCTRQDKNGKSHRYACMEDVTIPMSWNCSIPASGYPRPGDRKNHRGAWDREFVCKPGNNMAALNMMTEGPMTGMIMNLLNQKRITAKLSYLGKTEHFVNYNCPADVDVSNLDPSLQKLFRFSGAIKDGVMQQSAEYGVSFNGLGPVYKTRQDGNTNFDVLYCKKSADEKVDVSVSAKTGNMDYGAQSFTVDDRNPRNIHSLNFQKKGMLWGSWDSRIDVTENPASSEAR
jgi:hypothetical protein